MLLRHRRLEEAQSERLSSSQNSSISSENDVDIFSLQSDIEKYNLKLIFDCFNESFDFLRPYGNTGKPFPWKLNSRKLCGGGISADDIERV